MGLGSLNKILCQLSLDKIPVPALFVSAHLGNSEATSFERKVGFIENTAMRHRRGGGREVTVTSKLHTQEYIWADFVDDDI